MSLTGETMQPKTSLFLLLFVAIVAVAGCSGIPLSTMWHFRNFGPENLLQTDPTLIRAAVQLENGVHINGKSSKLDVEFKFEGEPSQKYSLPFVVLEASPWVGAGTGKADPGKHWYLFALSPEGVQAFRNMQLTLRKHLDDSGHFDEHVKVNVTVQTGHLDFGEAARKRIHEAGKMFLQIRLELSPRDGFYTLYDGHIPFTDLKDDDSRASD